MSKPGKRLSLARSAYSMEKHEKRWLGWSPNTWAFMKRQYHKRERLAVRDLIREADYKETP